MRIFKHLFLLFFFFAVAFPAGAGLVPTTSGYCYEIADIHDYQGFLNMMKESPYYKEDMNGRYYSDLNAKLTADITVPAIPDYMIGYGKDDSFGYAGTFDGNAHSITIDLTAENATASFSLFAELSAMANVKHSVTNLKIQYNGELKFVENTVFAPLARCISGQVGQSEVKDPTVSIHNVYIVLPSSINSYWGYYFNDSVSSGMIAYSYYENGDNYDAPQLKIEGCLVVAPSSDVSAAEGSVDYVFPKYYFVAETSYNVTLTEKNAVLRDLWAGMDSDFAKNVSFYYTTPPMKYRYDIIKYPELADDFADDYDMYQDCGFYGKVELDRYGLEILKKIFIEEDNCWGLNLDVPNQLPQLLSNDDTESDIRLYVHSYGDLSNIPHHFNEYGICDAVEGAHHFESCSILTDEETNEDYFYIENEGQFLYWATTSGIANSKKTKLKPKTTFDFTPSGANYNWTDGEILRGYSNDFDGQGSTIKFYSQSWFEAYQYGSEEEGGIGYEYNLHTCRSLFKDLSAPARIHDLIIDAYISDVVVDIPEDQEVWTSESQLGVLSNNIYMSGDQGGQVTIENVTVKGSITSQLPSSVGGFFGAVSVSEYSNPENFSIHFANCTSEISIETSGDVLYAGGFVGRFDDAALAMTGCKSTGKVAISDVLHEAYSGGFVGYSKLDNENPIPPSIYNSYNTAKLIATSQSEDRTYEDGKITEPGFNYKDQTNVGSFIGSMEYKGYDVVTSGVNRGYAFYESVGDKDNTPVCNGSLYQASGIRFIGGRSDDSQTLYCYSQNDPNNRHFTSEQFHSGYITYLLNKEDINGTEWCLDADSRLPELGSNGLQLYKHGENVSIEEHKFVNGVCVHGGDFEDPEVENDKDNTVYIVSNAGQMMRLNEMFKENPGQFLNSTIKLGNDIDLSDYTWRSNINLNCSFLGDGNTIKFVSNYDSYIERINKGQFEDEIEHVTPATGLFLGFGKAESGSDELIVSNLKLEVDIETRFGADETDAALGALFSRLNVDDVSLKIDHVSARGSIALSDSPSQVKIGGLIGSVYAPKGLTITNSFTDINIAAEQLTQQDGLTADGSVVYRHIGGLLGFVESSSFVSVMGCATHGSISDTGLSFSAVGGIVGSLYSSNSYIIKNYTTTRLEINNSSTYIGSFIGHIANIDKNFSANNYMSMFAYYSEDNEPQLYDLNSDEYTKRRVNHIGNVGLFNNNEWENDLIYSYSSYATLPLEPVNIEGAMEERTDLTADMLKSGKIAYLFSETKFDVTESSYFSQKLGEQDYPVLVAELPEDQEPYTVYPTCNENVFANVNYWKYLYLDGEIPAGAEFEHQYNSFHVCKYCGRIEEGEWDNEVVIEDTEDLVNMVDNLTLLTENSIPVQVTVAADIVYSDVDYTTLTESQLQESLPAKEPVGTKEKPFIGSFNGDGNELINFAFSQNGLFGQIGQIAAEDATDEEKAEIEEANKNVKVENVSISNGVVYNNLENVVKDLDENNVVKTYYAAALANVNNGVIDYCSFVGAMSIPEGVGEDKVLPCLVGENNGVVSHSFVFFTNLSDLKSLSDDGNKAAILVKGNAGIGRSGAGAGQSKKVAANTTSSYAVDEYGQSGESKLAEAECLFSNAEFASGVVAYWLNFEGAGYSGDYTCKYAQGKLTPTLSDGTNGIHRIVYSSNKSATITGQQPYANAGSVLDLTFSEPVSSVKINDVDALRISDTNYKVTIPNVADADVEVTVTYVAGSTDMETLNPDRTTVVATSEGIRVFGAEGQTVFVYNLNGSLVYSSTLPGNAVLIPALVRGVYFVKVGNTTTKVLL